MVLLLHIALCGHAQIFSITGKIIDSKTGEGLPGANVFLDKSTIGTASFEDGQFLLNGVPPGVSDLVISYVGYKLNVVTVSLYKEDLNVGDIKMLSTEEELTEIEVVESRDKEWERNVSRFERVFLGTSPIGKACSIVNPWVINFEEIDRKLVLSASEPIQINNDYLGYKISFFLSSASMHRLGYSIKGNILFQERKPSDAAEALLWAENRHKAYLRSSRHFFKALVDKTTEAEGFRMYVDMENDDVASSYFEATDNFRRLLDSRLMVKDTSQVVEQDDRPDTYRLKIDKRIEVHYTKARAWVRTYTDIGYPVSWILAKGGYLYVNERGVPLNSNDLITSGDMNDDWMARMLPSDYVPPKIEQVEGIKMIVGKERYRENVYLHTDKPYYYVGEPIWFKAYVNYYSDDLVDSLSSILYADLIDREGKIIETKSLLLNQGFAWGNFVLQDTLPSGLYYVRAYTNLMRNFGDSALFVKPLSVLKLTERVEESGIVKEASESTFLSIRTPSERFGTRDRIDLEIEARDEMGRPMASHLSISVTDAKQVVRVPARQTILSSYYFNDKNEFLEEKFKYPLESGITVAGKVLNGKGKPSSATVTMLSVSSKDLILMETDKRGEFWVSGLGFYEEDTFLFQAKNRKDKPFGSIIISPKEIPPFIFAETIPTLSIIETEQPQRIISEYEVPKEVRLLEEVTIKAEKYVEGDELRTYGNPDYILMGKDINTTYGNLLLAIQGQFPGLVVRFAANDGEDPRWVVYTQRAASLNLGREVLVTINDVAMTGQRPAELLASINPETVESITFTARLNPLYGEQGAFGVLSIYTTERTPQAEEKPEDFQVITIPGYTFPRKFRSPDYSDDKTDRTVPDYRATLYWNPEVITDVNTGKAQVSFYAADLVTRYRVVIEGVARDNRPLRGEFFIEVED
ncbi:MAG: carboxypeptidase-like regulatory domain-containing protein [Cyclobacteriaceae bacterium]